MIWLFHQRILLEGLVVSDTYEIKQTNKYMCIIIENTPCCEAQVLTLFSPLYLLIT